MLKYQVTVEQHEIYKLIESNGLGFKLLTDHQKINILAISHLYLSSKQTIPFSDFVFEMMTDGLTNEMDLPEFIKEEVALTNGRIYFDSQVLHMVKHICKIYDKKELAKLLYYQSTENKLFELIVKNSMENYQIENENAIKLAAEICRFTIKELPVNSDIYLIKL